MDKTHTPEPARTSGVEAELLDETVAPARPAQLLFRYIPALDSLRHYSWRSLRLDLVAGLTVAAVAVPQAMAYATIAGLAPQYGLYTAIVMTAVGALLDSSRQLINGPTNALCIALLSALATVPDEHKLPYAFLLAFLIGVIQTGITLMRLGDLTRFISHSVIVGFTLGAALLLVMDQFKNLVGIANVSEENFVWRFVHVLGRLREINPWSTLIGVSTMVLVLGIHWIYVRFRVHVPEFLLAIGVMALVVWLLDLEEKGVALVGDIPRALPSFQAPQVSWMRTRELMTSALALSILGLLEAIAMAKAIASRTRQKLDINQQCLSEGLANLTGSFFQCFPGSGSLTRSNINVQAGAVSQWSGVIAAAAVALTVLALAPLAYYIPRAALAGILMISSWRLVDRKQLMYYLRTTRFDAGIVLATALAAIVVSVEFCILIGVFLSFVMFVPRAAHLHLTELVLTPQRVIHERQPNDPACGKILIFNLEGELFFGAAAHLERLLDRIARRAQNDIRVVVLRLKHVRNPDAVCLELFDRFLGQMEARRINLLLCGVRPDMARALHTSGLEKRLKPGHIFQEKPAAFSSTLDAVRHAYDLLNGDLCSNCPRRGELGKEVLYYMI